MWTFSTALMTLLMLSGFFLVALILLQRGRGGGLASAFGRTGGDGWAGVRAGDLFTKITIGTASVWILLCASGVISLHHASAALRTDDGMFKKAVATEVKSVDDNQAESPN